MRPLDEKNNEIARLAVETLAENKQFVRAVTSYADDHEILASEDIYSQKGIKLIPNGTRISKKFYDRLVAHKLLKPIEQSLAISDALDARKLVELTHAEAHRVPSLAPMLENRELLDKMQGLLGDVQLPAPLALKISVIRVDQPNFFQHCLITAMLSRVLAVRANLSRDEIRALALASIFHDLGETCIAPDIFAPQHKITEAEYRHLYTHPITGYLMLHDFSEIPEETAIAVLQHHERLDGSGYPYRLPGEQIGKVSRFLAVAEFCSSLLQRYGADKRIQLKLWLNRSRYDKPAMEILFKLFADTVCPLAKLPDEAALMSRLTRIGNIFEDWRVLRESFSAADVDAISYFIKRVNSLQMLLLEFGFDKARIDEVLSLSSVGDPEICMEINILIEELARGFKDLYGEVQRKMAVYGSTLEPSVRARVHEWLMCACSLGDDKVQ